MARKLIVFLAVFIPLIGLTQVFNRKINQWDDKFNRHGLWITWQNESKHIPSCKSRYNHGKEYRVTRYYHENGKTRIKYRFKRNNRVIVSYFDINGHLTDKGSALQLVTDSEYRFCWDGEWKQYNEHHKVIKTSYYKNGEELNTAFRSTD